MTLYGYDAVSRLASLEQDLVGAAHDLALGFTYNPASQIASSSRSNDAYSWLGHGGGSTASAANGLNQIALHGGVAPTHDSRGNLRFDPSIGNSYGYSSENLLTSVVLSPTLTGTLAYDPLMRLSEAGVSVRTKIVHDGQQRIAEYPATAGAPGARFVNGPGLDEPLVEYQGSGLATRRWLHSDERGSIVARSDDWGNLVNINTFDEQGLIGPTNAGRFHFAGQPYETLSDLYYSRARMRNPRLGRFNQPDPIGYEDGMNFYAYVKGDPVNLTDPLGLKADEPACGGDGEVECPPIIVTANFFGAGGGGGGSFRSGARGPNPNRFDDVITTGIRQEQPYRDIVVTAIVPEVEIHTPPPATTYLAAGPNQTPVPSNDNWPSEVNACYVAKKICVSNSNSIRYDRLEQIRRVHQCRLAAQFCAAQTQRNSKLGGIWFPDGTVVTVIGGKAYILKRGPRQ